MSDVRTHLHEATPSPVEVHFPLPFSQPAQTLLCVPSLTNFEPHLLLLEETNPETPEESRLRAGR